jgi:ABC-type dipeptide/oligopeptide/nickel transport system permease component
MGKYLLFRLLAAIPVLFGVLLIVFVLLRLIPGDPVDIMFQAARKPRR